MSWITRLFGSSPENFPEGRNGVLLRQLKTEWERRMAEGDDTFTSAGIAAVMKCLKRFEERAARLEHPSKRDMLPIVKASILELNAINEKHAIIDTLEREELCHLITQIIASHGVGLAPKEDITEEWREW